MSETTKEVAAFEAELDAALAARPIYKCSSSACLALAANSSELAHSLEHYPSDNEIDRGIMILAPHFVGKSEGDEPDLEVLMQDLAFASHFYMLREYLYYSHNAPGAIEWCIKPDLVEVRFRDRTIPRQFFTVWNDYLLLSAETLSAFNGCERVRNLLKGEPECTITSNVSAAYDLIAEEADLKLRAYFSILPTTSDIDLGGYTYAEFVLVYRKLLQKALYHRYFARVNGAEAAVFIGQDELIAALAEEAGIAPPAAEALLSDLVYDSDAPASRTDASYFSLLREGTGDRRIVMRPHHFAINEGLVMLLRVIAQRRPSVFLDKISTGIGNGFVRRVKEAWETQGFICRSNVSLARIDPSLPDIDLLAISEEPTLGFVVFVCELKSPIPPLWAKDQLRALNRDGVSKAFRQSEALGAFLKTDEGIVFLFDLLPPENVLKFDGFVVVVDRLIITSDNAGMFFGSESTKIVNFRTLERLLKRSDGDVAFIQHMLASYNDEADKAVRTKMVDFKLGSRLVRYEVVTDCPILDFPTVKWRSSPERQTMIADFITSGAHPFDVFPSDVRNRIEE